MHVCKMTQYDAIVSSRPPKMGALSGKSDGKENLEDGELTFLGRVLAHLPIDLNLGKMVVLGYVFGCLDDCLIIGQSVRVRPNQILSNVETKHVCDTHTHTCSVCTTLTGVPPPPASCITLSEEFLCHSVDATSRQLQVSH